LALALAGTGKMIGKPLAGRFGMNFTTLADASDRPDNNFNLIRLVAAWAVIYGHSYALSASMGQDLIVRLLNFKFAGGIAVDVFFVISGLLIAASLERNRLPSFLMSRALRILPALVVCVAFCAFVLGPILTTASDYWHRPDVWHYFVANARLAKSLAYFLPGVFETLRNHAVNGSLWSLPIEARLYLWLAAFGLLSLNQPRRFNPIFIGLIIAGFMLLTGKPLSPEKSNLAYCQFFFLTGAFAWINRSHILLAWPLLALVLLIAAGLHGTDYFYIGYSVALSYGTLFLAYVPKLPVIRHHDLSYGLYLYGWPSQQLVQTIAPSTGAIANTIWATLLAGAFAAASWFLIESPALRMKSRFRIKRGVATDAANTPDTVEPPAKEETA
jgi:peptidoglycan/LPS O-acetylase OafA/YrhL